MNWLRLVSYMLVTAVVVGASPGDGIVTPSAALAQTRDAGVFGLSQADWDASLGSGAQQSDGYVIYQLTDGGGLYVRFDDVGTTVYVEYQLGTSLSFADMELFVIGELLPGDASYLGQHQDIMVGNDHLRVTVQLYDSDAVIESFPGNTGTILVAYAQDGYSFSVSIT